METGNGILKQNELSFLTNNFRLNISGEKLHAVASENLLDEHLCIEFLDWFTGILDSPSRKVTASQFNKRYAFSTVAPTLYAMTMYNKGLDVSLNNCEVVSVLRHESLLPTLSLANLQVTQPSASALRKEWRDEIIKHLFAEHLAKIWHVLAKVTKIPKTILWENTAVRVYSLYEKAIETACSEEKVRLQEDYVYLLQAPGTLFGESNNPLAAYHRPLCKIPSSEQQIRIRKTCCFYYTVSSDGSYCSACPRIKY